MNEEGSTGVATIIKMIGTVLFVIVALFAVAVALPALIFFEASVGFILLCIATLVLITTAVVMLAWAGRLLKKLYYAPVILAALSIVCLVSLSREAAGERRLLILDEQRINLSDYRPFEVASQLARLGGLSSFRLPEGRLPRLDCATSLYPMAAAFVEAVYPPGDYPPDDPDGLFFQTGTDSAYERLIRGDVDIIFAEAPAARFTLAAEDAGVGLQLVPIGKEAFVFFVGADNPVERLTLAQIRGIYGGAFTNWGELGGDSADIRPFQSPAGSSSQSVMMSIMQGAALLPPTDEEVRQDGKAEEDFKGAIGYTFRRHGEEMAKSGRIKLLEINGVRPTDENIRNGSYPITTRFYAVTAGNRSGYVESFIQWITSPEGGYLVEQSGYVPL